MLYINYFTVKERSIIIIDYNELIKWNNYEYCKKEVKINSFNLLYVHNQTKELCKTVLKQDGTHLQFIHNKTKELCEIALRQNKEAINFIDIKKHPDLYILYKLLYN